jgi:uncharacterized ParB-like nuclease family protein
MQRMITLGPLLILSLLVLPMPSLAEERSDWRQPLPETTDVPQTLAKIDTAAGGSFSASDAQALLEQAGYAAIGDLEQVNPLVWRATGQKDGATYALTVDYGGTVVGFGAP